MAGNWQLFLSGSVEDEQMIDIRKHERTGRPLGSESFVESLESVLERP
jgi:putative transposase